MLTQQSQCGFTHVHPFLSGPVTSEMVKATQKQLFQNIVQYFTQGYITQSRPQSSPVLLTFPLTLESILILGLAIGRVNGAYPGWGLGMFINKKLPFSFFFQSSRLTAHG